MLMQTDADALISRYTVQTTRLSEPRTWERILVEILFDGDKVGEYERNYKLLKTFQPFAQYNWDTGEVETYALYSKDYTATRVMRLPDCEDLCGEEGGTGGFYPVEFYVPYAPTVDLSDPEAVAKAEEKRPGSASPEVQITGQFGFVAGCVWADDVAWKIQCLDLSRVRYGELTRTVKFGYLELPDLPLRDCVRLFFYSPEQRYIHIAAEQRFNFGNEYPYFNSHSDVDEDDVFYLVSEAEGMEPERSLWVLSGFMSAYDSARKKAQRWADENRHEGQVRWNDGGRFWFIEDAMSTPLYLVRVQEIPYGPPAQ